MDGWTEDKDRDGMRGGEKRKEKARNNDGEKDQNWNWVKIEEARQKN